jgi:hypothetical protein
MSAAGPQWISLASAAGILGTTAPALRKSLEARAAPSADGIIEAELNGNRGRKQGRTWRVLLGPSGTSLASPSADAPPAARGAGAGLEAVTLAAVDQLHAREAVHRPARRGAVPGEHSVGTIRCGDRLGSSSPPRRGRSFVVTMADATATAGRREVTAKIIEIDTPPDQADRLGFRLADGVLDLVAEILVELVREDEGRDGAAAIVDRGGAGT